MLQGGRDKGRPVLTAKRWLGAWLGVRGPVKAPPSLCAMRDVGKSRAQIHEDADQHGRDARRLRRAITDEGRNLVGDKKKARVDENGYVRSTDRIWKGLGEGRSAATELRGQAGGLQRRRPARGDERRSLLVSHGAVPAMRASKRAGLRRLNSKWESTLLCWQEMWQ